MGRKSLANERRLQIIEVYYRCLSAYGNKGCTFANIAREAGMAPSIINHYFSSKQELVEGLNAYTIEKYESALLRVHKEVEDPWERLKLILSTMFSDDFIDKDLIKAYISILHSSLRDEDVRSALAEMYGRFFGELREVLLEVAGSDNLAPDEAEKLAIMLVALQDGMMGHWLLNPDLVRPSMAIDVLEAHLERVLKPG
ncbi:MAG: TetR/AcrR family transcriptional regulator [Actinomycetota bacterium]